MVYFDGLLWLLLLLGPLFFLQRSLHREIQAVLMLLTRRSEISLAIFSLLFFPGVLLHEFSHFLMAQVLGVRTGRFSLLPMPLPDGRMRLGYVETASADFVRDSLIGVAPLISGGIFVAFAGLSRLGLPLVWDSLVHGGGKEVGSALSAMTARPDFWLWFYLAFVVSSTMLPSSSDRRAWLPMVVAVALLVGLALLAGAGTWMVTNLAPSLNDAMRALAVAIGISVILHVLLVIPIGLLRRGLSRLTGLEVR